MALRHLSVDLEEEEGHKGLGLHLRIIIIRIDLMPKQVFVLNCLKFISANFYGLKATKTPMDDFKLRKRLMRL